MKKRRNHFSYHEPKISLKERISAHAKYGNLDLEKWVKDNFNILKGDRILDLGCGNGKFMNLFINGAGREGFVLGLDKNQSLVNQANKNTNIDEENAKILTHDFDDVFPKKYGLFNWVFAIYSIYYAENALDIVQKVQNLLLPGGKFVIIGPGPNNIIDLMNFNQDLVNFK